LIEGSSKDFAEEIDHPNNQNMLGELLMELRE
jgi:hypothetical protein